MVSCAACGCSQTSRNKSLGITFHHFPKDEEKKKKWMKWIEKENWSPKHTSVLCSQHFEPNAFDRSSKLKVRLLASAIPTIQIERLKYVRNCTEVVYIPLIQDHEYALLSTSTAGSQRSSSSPLISILKSSVLLDTPRKRQLKIRNSQLQKINSLKSAHIRKLQKLVWRQKKKITSLKLLTKELRQKNLMLSEHEDGSNKEIITRLFKKTRNKSVSRKCELSVTLK